MSDNSGLIGTAIGLAVLGGVVHSIYGKPRYKRKIKRKRYRRFYD